VQEYPFLDRERLPAGVLDRAATLASRDFTIFSARLRGSELDALLFDIKNSKHQKALQAGFKVLRLRFSPRLLKLISRLFQYNMESESLKEACRSLVLEAAERNSYPKEGIFLWKFSQAENLPMALCLAASEENGDLSKCCTAWDIDPKSPLARKSFFRFLCGADKSALLINRSWMISFVEQEESEALAALIKNYLSSLDFFEYQDGVCLAIWDRLGDPFESPEWETYTKAQRDSMAQWNFLHLLKIHALSFPQKLEILGKYHSRIRSCKKLPETNLLVIDFGEIVVVDLDDQPFSFFYQKEKYEEEMRRWEGEEQIMPVFLRRDRKVTTARDFIIEEKEEPYMKLCYAGVDRFYIQELMDIKMELEPDMRQKAARRGRKSK
jgi:hypothetical protein